MNKLQKKQLRLLESFIQVCDALQLRYFLVCGSALGAVKYRGFIPWDDDIDVGLMRQDYEIFLQKAPALLPEHIFLQNYRTEPAFPAIYTKLRDSRTTFVERSAARLPINHGISIDIFPLDGYPADAHGRRSLECRKWVCRRLLSAACQPNRWWKWAFVAPLRLLGVHTHTAAIARYYEKMISRYPAAGSKLIANHGSWQGKREYAPADFYGQGTWGEFEGLRVRLPAQYDLYLRQKYGDYEQDLPLPRQVSHHHVLVCDCSRSYREVKW